MDNVDPILVNQPVYENRGAHFPGFSRQLLVEGR